MVKVYGTQFIDFVLQRWKESTKSITSWETAVSDSFLLLLGIIIYMSEYAEYIISKAGMFCAYHKAMMANDWNSE